MVTKKYFCFNSCDGIHKIHGVMWRPQNREVIGFVQIIHGMTEYVDRYDNFARFLCDHGYAVAGEDHLGHGKTARTAEEYGIFAEKNGAAYVIGDNYRLKKHAEREFAGVPYFILGHSMGSFIARNMMSKYSDEIDGAIIMGTGSQPAIMTAFGKGLSTVMALFKGWRYRSALITKIAFGRYNEKFAEDNSPYAWLTKDKEIVKAYAAREDCTFTFTLAGYRDLFTLISMACRRELMRRVRRDLPVLIVSGAMDPVGNYGRGVKATYERYREAGLEDVTMKLYENDRHEILNETDRAVVYVDILNWLNARL